MRGIARRIASEVDGYSVLVPNPFYRVSRAPFTDGSKFDFKNPADMAKIMEASSPAEREAMARYISAL